MSHQDLYLSPQADQAERVISNHLFPLVYPFFSILFLVQDARRVPTMSSVLAMVVFAALAVRILIIQQRLSRAQQTLQFEASHDTLTGACNRAAIMDTLSKEIIRHARTQEPLGLMLADIDHFKAVNDKHGHAVGDQVLAAVVRRITESVRAVDSVGRYGGEEFLIVLPNCDSSGAVAVAERCRGAMADCPVQTSAGPICVSISIGVFSTTEAMPSGQSTLLRSADRALYHAKASGRNCVKQADAILCTDLC
jgi:diguanylate cyclase (GGDEF)-like protein